MGNWNFFNKSQEQLEKEGHTCLMTLESLPSKTTWCGQKVCVNKQIEQIDQEQMAFANELKDKGHICIKYLESYPVQISWCQQNTCNGNL